MATYDDNEHRAILVSSTRFRGHVSRAMRARTDESRRAKRKRFVDAYSHHYPNTNIWRHRSSNRGSNRNRHLKIASRIWCKISAGIFPLGVMKGMLYV